MSNLVLFHMWESFRQFLITEHLLYVEQAKKRLLSQFDDIEKDADKAAEDWLERQWQYFNPDTDDPFDAYGKANDVGNEFYQMLTSMRDRTRLSVVAGMYHEWEKQLRNWMMDEVHHWHSGSEVDLKIWSKDVGHLFDLFENLGWNIRGAEYYRLLYACSLVVNVYKHGRGRSLINLKAKYPEYLGKLENDFPFMESRDYTSLIVNESQIQAFSSAIVSFWKDVPERIQATEEISAPDWFEKAVLIDRSAKSSGAQS